MIKIINVILFIVCTGYVMQVVFAEMYERQIFGPGGKLGKCLGCFHMGVVVTLEHPCRKGTETR